eukprot:TRINITY_DN20827_c0_g1_i1.p1 TRINITY_DN20827_c0_g1~~TRINITY_DN20827_c0_g1_i1.p1  ORF type:complete len:387 (-),score=159.48 TRINITY_DN20827_c0_g1_i1:49-1125(-)
MENLDSLVELDTLNLSDNMVTKIKGIGHLSKLVSLYLANNKIQSKDDILALVECPSIQILDISRNLLDDPSIVEVLEQMPNLRVLNLMGNKVVAEIPHYRKTLVAKLKQLRYLDDMPVFPDERRTTEAWFRGGYQAEVEERKKIKEEEKEKQRKNMEAFERLVYGDTRHIYDNESEEIIQRNEREADASKKGNTPVRRNNAPNETIFGSEEDRNRWAVPVERNQQNSHEIDVTKDEEKAAEEILQTEYNETIDDAYKEEKDIIEDIEPNEISIPISIDDVDDGKMDKIEGDTWDDIPDLEKVEEEEIKEIEKAKKEFEKMKLEEGKTTDTNYYMSIPVDGAPNPNRPDGQEVDFEELD